MLKTLFYTCLWLCLLSIPAKAAATLSDPADLFVSIVSALLCLGLLLMSCALIAPRREDPKAERKSHPHPDSPIL